MADIFRKLKQGDYFSVWIHESEVIKESLLDYNTLN